MLRRFALGVERPDPDQLREWHVGRLFGADGEPLCEEADVIIRQFLDNPGATISAIIISRRIFIDPFQVRSFCRQMAAVEILEESPPLSACFRLSSDNHGRALLNRIRQRLDPGARRRAA